MEVSSHLEQQTALNYILFMLFSLKKLRWEMF